MKKIHKVEDLQSAILELEAKKNRDEEALKKQFHETVETFKPSNILKNTVSEVSASPQFKNNLLNLALGLGAGYITKKIAVGKKAGLLAKTMGTARVTLRSARTVAVPPAKITSGANATSSAAIAR